MGGLIQKMTTIIMEHGAGGICNLHIGTVCQIYHLEKTIVYMIGSDIVINGDISHSLNYILM